MDLTPLIDMLNKVHHWGGWKIIESEESIKIIMPDGGSEFNEKWTKAIVGSFKDMFPYSDLKPEIEIASPSELIKRTKIYSPAPKKPDPKLKVVSYSREERTIKNYDRFDDHYTVHIFVFNDGSVWEKERGKWYLIYQPEKEVIETI